MFPNTIEWVQDWDKGLTLASDNAKSIYVDFFLPGCIGCQQMLEHTYPNPEIISFINEQFIPLKLLPEGEISDGFFIRWTPVFLFLDPKGNEHHRIVGFLPPEQFLPAMMLGLAKTKWSISDWSGAEPWFDRIVTKHPQSHAAPESIYLRAICRYRLDEDTSHLKMATQKIIEQYPTTEWALRCLPYRLL